MMRLTIKRFESEVDPFQPPSLVKLYLDDTEIPSTSELCWEFRKNENFKLIFFSKEDEHLGVAGPYSTKNLEADTYKLDIPGMNMKVIIKIENIDITASSSSEEEDDVTADSTDTEESPQDLSWENLSLNSAHFFAEFPTRNNRISNIAKNNPKIQEKIVGHARDTRILVHPEVRLFAEEFLNFKRNFGSEIERNLYRNMISDKFFERLIKKRPLVFYTQYDITVTRGNHSPNGNQWRLVGTDQEQEIKLEKYLSYDEMQISALIGVSSPTFFINSGGRYNEGSLEKDGKFEPEGIYVGLVGARFEHDDLMESQHIIAISGYPLPGTGRDAPPEDLSTQKSQLWAKFYRESTNGKFYFPTFSELQIHQSEGTLAPRFRYLRGSGYRSPRYFNTEVYKKRMSLILETFFVDANDRGFRTRRTVYVHAVGLGLGVWQEWDYQGILLTEVFSEIIHRKKFPWISDLNLSWFPNMVKTCGGVGNGDFLETENGNKVRILISKRDPAAKLVGEDSGKILVACYAWDSNSFPGNEYWRGALSASGDPAAASCSTIPELQNPYVNKWFTKNIFPNNLENTEIVVENSEFREENTEFDNSGMEKSENSKKEKLENTEFDNSEKSEKSKKEKSENMEFDNSGTEKSEYSKKENLENMELETPKEENIENGNTELSKDGKLENTENIEKENTKNENTKNENMEKENTEKENTENGNMEKENTENGNTEKETMEKENTEKEKKELEIPKEEKLENTEMEKKELEILENTEKEKKKLEIPIEEKLENTEKEKTELKIPMEEKLETTEKKESESENTNFY